LEIVSVKTIPMIVATATLLSTNVGLAAERTVTLAVENMDCVSCPYIVKQSLKKLPGVSDVIVSFENGTATVTYDDATTGVPALITATTDAGYPSHVAI
jgi:mercuric ion binding protein